MSKRRHPSHDTGRDAHNARQHDKRHKFQPCGNPPAAPTGIVLTFQATEARTHLRFTGKLKWNEVTQDTQGHGARIKRYDVQMRAVDPTTAVPVETEDGAARLRAQVKFDPRRFKVTSAVITSGTTARFTTSVTHPFAVTDVVVVNGMKPTGYNGTWTITAKTATTFDANIGTSPAASNESGKVYEDLDKFFVITRELPRPKSWSWQGRVRAIDKDDCAGDWSAWTPTAGPIAVPFTGADPQPPAPTFGGSPITFDRIHHAPGKKRRWRLKFLFNEVVDWDVPGGDRESDVHAYLVEIDKSDDGTTWEGTPWFRKKLFLAKQDADADTTRTAHFVVPPRTWYRARVRTIDRFGRRGPWSLVSGDPVNGWSSAAFPNDSTVPPAPQNVEIFAGSVNRVVTKWDDPTADFATSGTVSGTSGTATLTGTSTKFTTELGTGTIVKVGGNSYTVKAVASDTSLTLTTNLSTSPSGAALFEVDQHYDVNHYDVQIAKFADVNVGDTPDSYSVVYMRDRTRSQRKAFKVKAADEGGTFYARVRSVDSAGNKSAWIPAWDTTAHSGNANNYTGQGGDATAAAVNGDWVDIGAGGGAAVVATFTKMGRLRVKHYSNRRWVNTTGQTLTFKRARATVGDREANTGAPTGAAVKINVKRWVTPETQTGHDNVFQVGGGGADDDRLKINDGTYKDVNGPSTFEITTLLPDEALTIRVAQVGSTFPGEDLTVHVYMEP